MLRERGRPDRNHVEAFLAAGFTEKQILDVVLAIAVKTISNYTNHLFGTPLDAAFRPREWKASKGGGKAA